MNVGCLIRLLLLMDMVSGVVGRLIVLFLKIRCTGRIVALLLIRTISTLMVVVELILRLVMFGRWCLLPVMVVTIRTLVVMGRLMRWHLITLTEDMSRRVIRCELVCMLCGMVLELVLLCLVLTLWCLVICRLVDGIQFGVELGVSSLFA